MAKTFSEALKQAVAARNPSLRKVATETGVSYDQLKRVIQGKTEKTNVEDARKIAGYFGKTIEEFIGCPELSDHIEIASLLSQLEPQERRVLLDVARAQVAARRSNPDK